MGQGTVVERFEIPRGSVYLEHNHDISYLDLIADAFIPITDGHLVRVIEFWQFNCYRHRLGLVNSLLRIDNCHCPFRAGRYPVVPEPPLHPLICLAWSSRTTVCPSSGSATRDAALASTITGG
jgi:hypothetical protein